MGFFALLRFENEGKRIPACKTHLLKLIYSVDGRPAFPFGTIRAVIVSGMGLGTWKNSTPELFPGLWDLEKFQALPLYRL